MEFEEWRRRLRIASHRHEAAEIVEVARARLPVECLQVAGAALLIALGEHHSGAVELAERCLVNLRARDAVGDVELVAELEAALGQAATPTLTPVPVDLEELGDALSAPMGDDPAIVDVESGAVWPAPVLELVDDLDEDDGPGEPDGVRWLAVWPEGSDDAYRDMQDFIATVVDDQIAARSAIAIQGKGAFGRFRDVIGRWPDETSRWHGFSDDRRRAIGALLRTPRSGCKGALSVCHSDRSLRRPPHGSLNSMSKA